MDLKNFDKSKLIRLHTRYEVATAALKSVHDQLLANRPESDGHHHYRNGELVKQTPGGPGALYTLYVSEWDDSSTKNRIELTGLLMHRDLLRYLEGQLKLKISELEKEIAAL